MNFFFCFHLFLRFWQYEELHIRYVLTNHLKNGTITKHAKTTWTSLKNCLEKDFQDTFEEYQQKRTGFEDPEDLIRMLRGAGVLDFRIAVQVGKQEGVDVQDMRTQLADVGPDNTDSPITKWFPLNNLFD